RRLGPHEAAYLQMMEDFLGQIQPERLIRVNLHAAPPEKNMDTFIGRAAHIAYLDCPRIAA
ncbi:unnamed protein product, partial [Heterosigma akashiwo]